MVVDQLGAQGSEQTLTDSYGDDVVETQTRGQLIAHGPESSRVYRRLWILRGLEHEQSEALFPGGQGTGRTAAV